MATAPHLQHALDMFPAPDLAQSDPLKIDSSTAVGGGVPVVVATKNAKGLVQLPGPGEQVQDLLFVLLRK